MAAVTDLAELLRDMTPVLHPEPYGYVVSEHTQLLGTAFAVIREDEGVTVVATSRVLEDANLGPAQEWARITLQIHSSLDAVGLTAVFAKALGDHDISANVIAGVHHDHIFVQWGRRHDALQALQNLSNSYATS
jgi:uncharacterized protein